MLEILDGWYLKTLEFIGYFTIFVMVDVYYIAYETVAMLLETYYKRLKIVQKRLIHNKNIFEKSFENEMKKISQGLEILEKYYKYVGKLFNLLFLITILGCFSSTLCAVSNSKF